MWNATPDVLPADRDGIPGYPCNHSPERKYSPGRNGLPDPGFQCARGLFSIHAKVHLLLFLTGESSIDGKSKKSCTGSKGVSCSALSCIFIHAFAGNSVVELAKGKMLPGLLTFSRKQAVRNTQHPGMRSMGTADFRNGAIREGVGIILSADDIHSLLPNRICL